GQFAGNRVLVERHGHAAERLRGQLRPVKTGTVVAEHGELVATLEPGCGQAKGKLPHVVVALTPGIGLPDAAVLFAHPDLAAESLHIALQQLGQSVHGWVLDKVQDRTALLVPRYAAMTAGSFCTSTGAPSAILRPRSSTTTWSEMSITTPISCSISTIVMPRSWLTSRMYRAMSSFSSWFMPPMGSSSSRTLGSSASARPSSTRLRNPYGSAAAGCLRRSCSFRNSMISSQISRWRISSR